MTSGPRRAADIATRTILDETLLVPVRGMVAQRMEIFALNPVAAFIWKLLDGTTTREQLTSAIVAEFEVDPERARADLDTLLAELEESGLVAAAEDE